MKCPFCGVKNKFRVNLYQHVDCKVDKNFYPVETGFDVTDSEVNKDEVWCENCGEYLSWEKRPELPKISQSKRKRGGKNG